MIGAYKIDGLDLYGIYKATVSEAPPELIYFSETKPVVTHDFGDENGSEYWVGKRFWQDVTFVLPIDIIADTSEEFWQIWTELKSHLQSPGMRSLFIDEYSKTFSCFYVKTNQGDRLTRIKGSPVAVRLYLQFQATGVAEGEQYEGSGGEVTIKDQNGTTIQVVQAPGEYQVIAFTGIKATRSGTTGIKIIAKK